MKWWTFNEQQLEAALEDFAEETADPGELARDAAKRVIKNEIKAFLESDAARTHKMRGDTE